MRVKQAEITLRSTSCFNREFSNEMIDCMSKFDLKPTVCDFMSMDRFERSEVEEVHSGGAKIFLYPP